MGNDAFEGFGVELIQEIAKFLSRDQKTPESEYVDTISQSNVPEFNYTLKWVDDGAYGSKNEDTGAWNGMLGEVLENVSTTLSTPHYIKSCVSRKLTSPSLI